MKEVSSLAQMVRGQKTIYRHYYEQEFGQKYTPCRRLRLSKV